MTDSRWDTDTNKLDVYDQFSCWLFEISSTRSIDSAGREFIIELVKRIEELETEVNKRVYPPMGKIINAYDGVYIIADGEGGSYTEYVTSPSQKWLHK